jgi:hypothetical protein
MRIPTITKRQKVANEYMARYEEAMDRGYAFGLDDVYSMARDMGESVALVMSVGDALSERIEAERVEDERITDLAVRETRYRSATSSEDRATRIADTGCRPTRNVSLESCRDATRTVYADGCGENRPTVGGEHRGILATN